MAARPSSPEPHSALASALPIAGGVGEPTAVPSDPPAIATDDAVAGPREGTQREDDTSRPRSVARAASLVLRYVPLVLFFVVWEIVSRTSASLELLLPPPTEVVKGGYELVRQGTLQHDVLASLKRVAVALLAACVIGYPLGIALGASRTFAWFFDPIVNFFRPIPPLAWIPLSIVWFGVTDAQNEFIIFLAAFFPIVLNTMEGVRDVDQLLVRAARTLGASRLSVALTIVLPAALPSMFVGLRVGTGIAWMALVAGELVAATSGLGFLISQGRMLFRSDFIIVGMVLIGLIGLALDGLLRLVQWLVMPWRVER